MGALRIIAATVVVAATGLAAGVVSAADWSVSAFVSERLGASASGAEQDEEADSVVGDSSTDLGLRFSARTPRLSLSFAPGVNLIASTGETLSEQSVNPRFNGSLSLRGPRLSVTGSASLTPRITNSAGFSIVDAPIPDPPAPGPDPDEPDPIDPDDPDPIDPGEPDPIDPDEGNLADVDTTDGSVLELVGRASLGASLRLDDLTSLSANGFARLRDFPDSSGSEFVRSTTVGASFSLNRRLSELTSVSTTLGYQRFTSEGEDTTTSDTYSVSGGLSTRLTERISASGSLGGSFVIAESDDADAGDDSSLSLTGGARLAYRGARDSFSIGISQGVDQNNQGELENQLTAFTGYSRRLAAATSASVNVRATFANPVFTTAEQEDRFTFDVAPSISHRLSENWNGSVGYRFRTRSDDPEPGHSVFVRLTRSFVILP